jgi:hypothetical protein
MNRQIRPAGREAHIRFWLGVSQMTGASFSGVLLILTGLNRFTLAAGVLTLGLTLTSLYLFKGRIR